jgi:thiol-disulfide isomerase/thioredoxin
VPDPASRSSGLKDPALHVSQRQKRPCEGGRYIGDGESGWPVLKAPGGYDMSVNKARLIAEAYTMGFARIAFGRGAIALVALTAALGLAVCRAAQGQTAGDPADQLMKEGYADAGAKKYDDAMKAFKKANQMQRDACADCFLQMAIVETKTGDYDHALKDCDKAIACASTDTVREQTHFLKGNILGSAPQMGASDPKKLKQAENEYRATLALDPHSKEAHLNLAIVLLRESQQADGVAELNAYLKLAPDGPDAPLARKLIEFPKEAARPVAPDFHVTTLKGDSIALSQLAGKVVVMDFWATWCPPCRESVPELKALTKKYPADKLVVISFSADSDEQAWKTFIAQKGMDWNQYFDGDGRIRNSFGVNAFPTYIVVDANGFVYDRIVGMNPMLSIVGQLKTTLKTILPE